MYAGYTPTYFGKKLAGLFAVDMPAHVCEHVVADMLQGDVEIFAHIVMFRHHVEYIHREVGGIGVVQTYPFHAGYPGNAVDKLGETVTAVKVGAVA